MADVPYATWKPTTAKIAAWARTKPSNRTNAGAVVDQATGTLDFTEQTTTRKSTVEALIDLEAPVVIAVVGEPCAPSLSGLAAQVVGYRVCAAINAEGRNGRTEPDWWTDQADMLLTRLSTLADKLAEGDRPGPLDGSGGLMASSFPPSPLSVVGPGGYAIPRPI